MRFRFEKASQVFDKRKGDVAILPINEITAPASDIWAELPSVIWPDDENAVRAKLVSLKEKGLTDVVCENIGAVFIAKELGFTIHGGLFLNIMNGSAAEEYKKMGLADITMSMELRFSEFKKSSVLIPCGFAVYGFMPLMKFRACPVKVHKGCNACGGLSEITDRLGEKFTVICRDKKYSELLNCVPLYVADKNIPPCDFTLCYFTKESKKEAEDIASMVLMKSSPDFRRTTGLYFRELL